eukprot:m51a1_g7423 DNA repair protein RAD50, putative (1970) ;mRNA; f:15754-25506
MTTMTKMLIQGVRSFSPDRPQTIEFGQPLTLIVGANGAGKTTIIECLKCACTGEFPPNSKNGQAFIHDTKVLNQREVHAQVKLRLKTAGGKPFVVSRRWSLTQAATKQTIKTLDSSIQTYDAENKPVVQSSRCADIDEATPRLMGVSKPVLEYVVFCHQEDSNWPLLEGAQLKKRFDEIFAATKYTRALDDVRKLRKEQAAAHKDAVAAIETKTVLRDNALKLRRDKADREERAREQARTLEELRAEVRERQAEVDRLARELQGRAQSSAHLRALKAARDKEREGCVRARSQLEQRGELVPESESDSALAQAAQRLQEEIERSRSANRNTDAAIKAAEERRQAARATAERRQLEAVQLQSSLEFYNKSSRDRSDFAAAFARSFFPGEAQWASRAQWSDEDVRALMDKGDGVLRSAEGDVSAARARLASVVSQSEAEIDSLKSDIARTRERISQRRAAREDAERRERQSTREARLLRESRARLDAVLESLAAEESACAQLRGETPTGESSASLMTRRKEVDARVRSLGESLQALSAQASARAKLDVVMRSCRDAEAAVRSAVDQASGALRAVLGMVQSDELPAPAELKKRVGDKHKESSKDVATSSQALNSEKMKLAGIQGELSSVQTALTKCQALLKESQRKLGNDADVDSDLNETIQTIESDVTGLRNELALSDSSESLYTKFIAEAQEKHDCPLCSRGFDTDKQFSSFIAQLRACIKEMPASVARKKRELSTAETKLALLSQARPHWTEAKRLHETEIPELERRIERLTAEEESAMSSVEDAERALESAKSRESQCAEAVRLAQQIFEAQARADKETQKLRDEEQVLRSSAPGVDTSRSADDVRADFEAAQAESARIGEAAEAAHARESAHAEKLLECDKRMRLLNEEAQRLRSDGEAAARHSEAAEKARAEADAAEQEVASLEPRVKDLESELRERQTERERAVAEAEAPIDNLRKRCEEVRAQLASLREKNTHTIKSATADGATRLEKLRAENRAAMEAAQGAESEASDLRRAAAGAHDVVARKELQLRSIVENQQYRQSVQSLHRTEAELEGIEAAESVERTEDQIESELNAAESKLADVRSRRDKLEGGNAEISGHVREIEAELRKAQYRDIDEEWRQAAINVEITDMAQHDLDAYYKSLDLALMRYHAEKMAAINEIVRDLWSKTYHGADIDTVVIKSDANDDEEGGATAVVAASTKVRTYHYRVVMMKDGVELDMRGRCSAGQKVLASLIIRMALSEAFCINCGILALDEPTTNLDRANVESFANALIEIISARRQQRSFQLVIITHDEEFVRKLGGSEQADCYWKAAHAPESDHAKKLLECDKWMRQHLLVVIELNTCGRYIAAINVEITVMAQHDLDAYYKLLDLALMRYHAEKMAAELDDDPVVKVLASLIIRMALSEAFCINYGIFALYKPTTNLDRANIESFTMRLAAAARRIQRAFRGYRSAQEELRVAGAVRLQAAWRGRRTRGTLAYQPTRTAATHAQALLRAALSAGLQAHENRAATAIQRTYRGMAGRRRATAAREARARAEEQAVAAQNKAATEIQRNYRGHLGARRDTQQTSAARVCQGILRAAAVHREWTESGAAGVRISRSWKRHKARVAGRASREAMKNQLVSSTVKIQRAWRHRHRSGVESPTQRLRAAARSAQGLLRQLLVRRRKRRSTSVAAALSTLADTASELCQALVRTSLEQRRWSSSSRMLPADVAACHMSTPVSFWGALKDSGSSSTESAAAVYDSEAMSVRSARGCVDGSVFEMEPRMCSEQRASAASLVGGAYNDLGQYVCLWGKCRATFASHKKLVEHVHSAHGLDSNSVLTREFQAIHRENRTLKEKSTRNLACLDSLLRAADVYLSPPAAAKFRDEVLGTKRKQQVPELRLGQRAAAREEGPSLQSPLSGGTSKSSGGLGGPAGAVHSPRGSHANPLAPLISPRQRQSPRGIVLSPRAPPIVPSEDDLEIGDV